MLIGTIAHALFSKARASVRIERIFMNSIYCLQAILVNLQVDGKLEYGWEYVAMLSWIYFGTFAIYFAAYLIILTFVLFNFAHKVFTCQPFTHINDMIGILWKTLYYSFSIFGILITREVLNTPDSTPSSTVLQKASKGALIVAILLIILTLSNFKRLRQFFCKFNNSIPEDYSVSGEENTGKAPIELQVEKKSSYFIMLSSTYFLPFRNASLTKDRNNIARIKRALSRLGFWRIATPKQNKHAKNKGPVDLATLKQYKTALDNKFSSKTQLSSNTFRPITILVKSNSLAENKTDLMKSKLIENDPKTYLDMEKAVPKPQFSSNDIDVVGVMDTAQCSSNILEEICYICCCEAANAVLMNCGHAGVCYECASHLLKKDGLCMECRSNIEAIHKIDPKMKFLDIVKGVEIGTIVKS